MAMLQDGEDTHGAGSCLGVQGSGVVQREIGLADVRVLEEAEHLLRVLHTHLGGHQLGQGVRVRKQVQLLQGREGRAARLVRPHEPSEKLRDGLACGLPRELRSYEARAASADRGFSSWATVSVAHCSSRAHAGSNPSGDCSGCSRWKPGRARSCASV